jgi:hypothetical protein
MRNSLCYKHSWLDISYSIRSSIMNIAEILRGLADKLDNISGSGESGSPQGAHLHKVDVDNDENPDINTQPMISPLQMQAELLKQATGQEGEEGGCEECGADPCECGDENDDELGVLQRNAGLPVMVKVSQ